MGLILIFIGAVLVVLGTGAFAATHRRNVLISIFLFSIGTVVSVISTFIIIVGALGSIPSGSDQARIAATMEGALTNLLIVSAVTVVVTSLSYVIISYELQDYRGRLVLWAALGSRLGIQAAIVALTIPLLSGQATEIASGIAARGAVDWEAISNILGGQAVGLNLFGAIPAALFATGYYVALIRINRGLIPAAGPSEVPSSPASGASALSPPNPPQ